MSASTHRMTRPSMPPHLFLPLLALCLAAGADGDQRSVTQSEPRSYKSRVPSYAFAGERDEQEAQLKTNLLMLRFAESRKKLSADPYRPIYHDVNPESALNDPNSLCFWQGLWRLFYQAYPPEDPRQHWGHAVSPDLIHCATSPTRSVRTRRSTFSRGPHWWRNPE